MVILSILQLWDIGRYFDELKQDGLEQNKDWVYQFAPEQGDGVTRVGIRFLQDSMATLYALKWA